MTDRMVALRADLVERLEALATEQGRSMNDVLDGLLEPSPRSSKSNWASAVVKRMEAADIDWIDDPDASTNSRKYYRQHLKEKWERSQEADTD